MKRLICVFLGHRYVFIGRVTAQTCSRCGHWTKHVNAR